MDSSKQKLIPVLIRRNHNILHLQHDYLHVFTNSSKDNDKIALAAVLNKTIIKKALRTESSIIPAEICAIELAPDIISKGKHKKFTIFSDSFPFPLSLSIKKLENPLIIKLLNRLNSMSKCKEIIIYWIPGHVGVRGNERANLSAKTALDQTPTHLRLHILT